MNISIIVKDASTKEDISEILKQIIADVLAGKKQGDNAMQAGKYRFRIYSDTVLESY